MTDSDTRPTIIKFVEAVNRAVCKPMDLGTLEPGSTAAVRVTR
ncbi:hypothetical protein [Pseudonocardia sp. 73-21]|nr:hypothetical protein [Pseudonocardia sp. 73-21]